MSVVEPDDMGKFEFVRLSTLRAVQLIGGCTPRVPAGRKATTTAQREVRAGLVSGSRPVPAAKGTKVA